MQVGNHLRVLGLALKSIHDTPENPGQGARLSPAADYIFRLNRFLSLPDGSLFYAHNRFSKLGWGLGTLF